MDVIVVAADVDAACGTDGETGVDSGSRDAGPAAAGTLLAAVGAVAFGVGGSPAVTIDEGSGFGVASVAFAGSAVRVAVSGTGRTEPAAAGFLRIGAAAARRGDERDGVDRGRPDAPLLEVTVDGDDFSGAVAVRSPVAGDRSSREAVMSLRSTVCWAGAASVTSVGAVAALRSIGGDAGRSSTLTTCE